MPSGGEERLLTLFGDVHYYFAAPGPRPVQHRFDKESYVYLYRDAGAKRGRLEIANHAGTPQQDAFTGYLDNATIAQSHRHPTLVTVAVDGRGGPPAPATDHSWRLPSTDPRDEGTLLFRLHTLDIYFWTAEDAAHFLQHAQATLPPQHFRLELPPAPAAAQPASAAHAGTPVPAPQSVSSMSPVVQNLEHVAISDPAYRNASGPASRSASTAATLGSPVPPPSHSSPGPQPPLQQQQQFQPLAYNPAAPPAPEAIKHREKTPPPPEEPGPGGLRDHLPGPPASAPPPSHAQQRYVPQGVNPATYARTAAENQQPLDSPTDEILGAAYAHGRQHSVGHRRPQYADYLGSRPEQQTSPPPPPAYAGSSPQPHRHHHHHSPPQEVPQFDGPPSQASPPPIHSQAYVPDDGEHTPWGNHKPSKHGRESVASQGSSSSHGQSTVNFGQGGLEQRAARVERGVNKWLNKLEKKIG